jgi:lysophospholipase L1-like esterase
VSGRGEGAAGSAGPGPAERRLGNGLVVLAALVVSLLLAEAILRLRPPPRALRDVLTHHPVLGWTFEPGGQRPRKGRRHPVELAFSRLGFRDVEHSREKPAGVRRIVVLGDSFAAGTQVEFEHTFPRRLQRLLETSGDARWEVVSLAVNGYGTAQEWLALEHYGLGYDPDVVLLQFFANDVCNNSVGAARYCAFNNEYRPYYVEEGDDLRLTTAQPLRNLLRRHLRSYLLLEHAVRSLRLELAAGDRESRNPGWQFDVVKSRQSERIRRELGLAINPFWMTYAPDDEQIPIIAAGWRITERIVESLAGRLGQLGIPLLVLVLPEETAIDEVAWERLVARGRSSGVLPELVRTYPEDRLGRLLERLGVPAVMMLPRLVEQRDVALPYWKYHLNPEGHRLTAEALHDALVAEGLATASDAGPEPGAATLQAGARS